MPEYARGGRASAQDGARGGPWLNQKQQQEGEVAQISDVKDSGSSTGAFFMGLFAGAVIGAGLGLWFAPKAGAEMREQITGAARDVNKRVSKTMNDITDRSREALDRAREVLNTAGDQLQRMTGGDGSGTSART